MPTKIEWAEETWNPITGCTPISPGCANCYAERMSKRLAGRCGYPADEPFRVTVHPDRLNQPFKWRKPRRVFVCSMGDLFHPDVPFEFIDRVFSIMALCPQHTFLVLTKRPDRMREYLTIVKPENAGQDWRRQLYFASGKDQRLADGCCFRWPLPNVRLGVTAENQEQADKRIPILLQIPAAVRFVSVEPMLGPVDLQGVWNSPEWFCPACDREVGAASVRYDETHDICGSPVGSAPPQIDWVICGGETGPGARPMHPDWARSLRDQCKAAGVPFLFKSWGEWVSEYPQEADLSHVQETYKHNTHYFRVGKKAAGRLLDGHKWNEMPGVE